MNHSQYLSEVLFLLQGEVRGQSSHIKHSSVSRRYDLKVVMVEVYKTMAGM